MTQAKLKRANPNTIQDKLLVGYQGWFTYPGDGKPIGPGHHGWLHWFNTPIPNGHPNVDLWPDTSEYDPSELYPVPGLATRSGDPVHLFSSRNPRTVQRHFHWMALHGVDGAFLQRFASQCEIKPGNLGLRDLRDEVGDRVREAAEAEGRVFAIMYDVSGVPLEKIQTILEQDWAHLINDKRILDSPSYLYENGRPVVTLWGFGFNGRDHTPELVRRIAAFFHSYTPEGVYLIAGVPGHWRTSTSDADRNPEFVQVWTECFDAITPWTIGRYATEEGADRWGEQRVKADADYLRSIQEQGGRKVDYMPVVFPGGSGFNLSQGKWGMNDIRRNGGRFLWQQIYNARRAGVRTIYGAMWDEYDEGTVFMPVVPYASQLPVHSSFRFIALDVDGQELPSDWYMRIAGFAAEALHGERTLLDAFPFKELQDYWSTRPRYESIDDAPHEGQAGVDEVTQAFGKWQVSGSHGNMPVDAPPPYSLEDASVQPGLQAPWAQHERRQSAPAVASGGAGGLARLPPPVPLGSRPLSPSVQAAAVPLAAAAIASTLSAGGGQRRPSAPPAVDMSTRPVPSQTRPRPQHVMSPSLPARTYGDGHMPQPVGGPWPGSAHLHHGRPMDDHRRGRKKHRSHSRSSGSSSGSRSRRRRSSSAHRDSKSAVPPLRVHGHGLSPVDPLHSMGFPAPGSLHHAYSDSGYAHGHGHGHEPVRHGSYSPIHSTPVGFGDVGAAPAGHGPAYTPYGVQNHPYAMSYPNTAGPNSPQGYDPGYGYGRGQGQLQGQGFQHPYGYTPHPSSSSPYYTSYVPGTESSYNGPIAASGGTSGTGRGGIQGGIASALQAVESLAGKNTRNQLEKKVKTFSNSFNKLR